MSLAALPADPALPELRVAGDPDEMAEVFRRRLRPLRDGVFDLEGCRVSRVHYHRGDRCALRYTLRLVERATGRRSSQWVTGLLYAGDRASRVWEKLRHEEAGPELAQAFPAFEPVSFVSHLKLVVQVFPFDRHLPALPRLTLAPPPDLEPLFLASLDPGDRRTSVCRVAPAQYRVGRAAVLRYEVELRNDSAAAETTCFFAKVYRRHEQAERAHRVLRYLSEEPEAGFGVARPVGHLGELHTTVQEAVPGTSLEDLVLRGEASAARRAAQALTSFRHGSSSGLPRHRLGDEFEVLWTAGRVLGWACPHLTGNVERVVDAIAARLNEAPPARTHGELKAAHVFFGGDALAVVDVDSCSASDPLLDPARILADLAGQRFRLGEPGDDRWTAAAEAFADEYLREAPGEWRARLVPHYAGALLKEAVDFFRHLEPGWAERVPLLVAEAEATLSRSEW